ncbi:glycosyl hydrolase family 18 protein [Symbiobacterium thermophilum]|uniref:GH18 domain-containing protein n=1 Tax=Symbiobacterium thermophilum TaxID=2734 RepID=A0A953I431_SYMTR|nr:glycosyl hydrolase family 18 protein [Symbiobacterium thermophilum]MBY6276537.1 hypothetical protein [Symbiobacterium thermophilum]
MSFPDPRQPIPAHPHRPRRRTGWAVLAALLVAAAAGAGGFLLGQYTAPHPPFDPLWLRAYLDRPLDTAPPGEGFWIAGYYVDYDSDSLESVRLNAHHLDQVIVFGYGFDAEGNAVGKDQTLIRGVTSHQKRVLLFGNFSDAGFDPDLAHRILTDPVVQERAMSSMLDEAGRLGVSGIQIDFENIPPEDREAYTQFLRRLKERLEPLGLTLSVAAAAKTSDTTSGWGGATDYAAIGQIVDHFYIMAYDQHWLGGEPGPVASLDWTERVIRYAIGVMPSQKILLGVPLYGYEWALEPELADTNAAYGPGRMQRRAAQFGAEVVWDPVHAENRAVFLTDEGQRVAWFPDERSLEAKLRLAYQYNLKGIVVWRVGLEPDDWWHRMGEFRLNPEK